MGVDDVLYNIGEGVELFWSKLLLFISGILQPRRSDSPPNFRFLKKFVRKELTVHELLSLRLQLVFIVYLFLSLALVLVRVSVLALVFLFVIEFSYIRYIVNKYRDFFVDSEPYRVFYYSISLLSFAAFGGYSLLRSFSRSLYPIITYIVAVFVAVLTFRAYFKRRYGRDYTYGVVEEVKNDLVRVFVHDDIAANVKPGYYWVERVQDAEPGTVVKLLLEDRKLRGAVPSRILEVYLRDQSSQTSSEPKNESE
ncbi:DUF2101 family protein [Thermococcus sp.]